MPMSVPSTIAHYNILEPIGSGRMGDVYRARDTRVGRTVALKIVSPEIVAAPARLARFMDDARAAMALSHPNVATLFDAGESEGHAYLAYEFAQGRLLREEMAGTAMNPRRALDLAVQLADGVADAHARGVIHGDLRPDVVIVTAKGSAKVLDFGMAPWTRGGMTRARAAREPDALGPDAVSVVAYLSPEQAVGGAIDVRSDVFCLGTVTYEMLTGCNPFLGATPADIVVNVIQGKVPPASEANHAVPAEIDPILSRALSRDISERQQSAASLAAELRSVAAMLDVRTGDVAEPSMLLPIDDRPDRRASGLLFGALAAAAAAAAAVWWWLTRS